MLWAGGIVAFGISFLNLNALRNLRYPFPLVDTAIVAALMLACIALHAHDLRDWYYAAIGDDIGFFLRMRDILESGIRDPFAIDGMYGNSPMLNSIYQAFVSWVFGGGAWGWKFSSVISVAVTVPAIYGLGRLFRRPHSRDRGGRRTGKFPLCHGVHSYRLHSPRRASRDGMGGFSPSSWGTGRRARRSCLPRVSWPGSGCTPRCPRA